MIETLLSSIYLLLGSFPFSPPYILPEKAVKGPLREDFANTDDRGSLLYQLHTGQWGIGRLDLEPHSNPSLVAFRVLGPVHGLQLQDENQPAIGDLDAWISWLTSAARSDREKAEALFDFTVREMKDWYYPAQGQDVTVEDLNTLIWNFGFGYCYDLGRLQAGLWAKAGLRSRIVGWPQHTVAEVRYQDAWHLYDLQHRDFYQKKDGSVASFQELKKDPDLFLQSANEFGLDAVGYPPDHLAAWYEVANPNFQDSKDQTYWRDSKNFSINLRWRETFEIVFHEPAKVYHPPSWFQYYGPMTLRHDPPWPIQGRQRYAPHIYQVKPEWEQVRTPTGVRGVALAMANPFIITEAWLRLGNQPVPRRIWLEVGDQIHFMGQMVGPHLLLTKKVEGGHSFRVIIEAEKDIESGDLSALDTVELHARLQLSPIGLPQVRPGRNWLPMIFQSGKPIFQWYIQQEAADLAIISAEFGPKKPRVGDTVQITYIIVNLGTQTSEPTSLTVFNNTTSFLSETTENIAVQTIPPIKPKEQIRVQIPWIANTRMTWYGQNPNHQLFDAWIDLEKNRVDSSRHNNRHQHYVVLAEQPLNGNANADPR